MTSFEDILRDPNEQFDPRGELLKSIMEYSNAESATASAQVRATVPGWEGATGPFPAQYNDPHVYARDVHSGAGNCVCGRHLGSLKRVQAAPGVPIPNHHRS